jgi:CubicO group peptidase (beta-lactamase class C family)
MKMRKVPAIAAALLTCLGGIALAQQGPSLVPPKAPAKLQGDAALPVAPTLAGTPVLTRQDAEGWLDGFMPYALQRGDVAGATVAIVKDGQILFQKGYGFSDVEKRLPVDPDKNLFRPGSVSKLFTWTAVMQQVEAGKLNLDADVNQYIDFKIPAFEGKPITLRNIMTHTTGFEERIHGLINNDVHTVGLERALKAWIPERVFAPGSTPAYSNYATALAGYIVQRVSGEPFEDYIDHHIFQPLGMQHSSFHQPLRPDLLQGMSKGYLTASKPPKPYEFIPLAPAGSLASTGPDMARFMIAHLENGRGILKPETAKLMHDTAYTVLPPLNRMLLGFYENSRNGHRVITHAGDSQLFHSELNLFLDDHVGIFVSMNSTGAEGAAGTIRTALFQQFADRYFPAGQSKDGQVDPKTAAEHAKQIAGLYDVSRAAHSSFVAAMGFLGQTKVLEDGKGSILIPSIKSFGGAPKTWKEISPYVWREVGGQTRVAAQVVDGKVVRFSFDNVSPFMVWDRAPWWRSTGWLTPAVYASLLALLLTVVLWPVAAIVRRRFNAPAPALPKRALWAHRGVRVAALLALLVPLGWMSVVQSVLSFAGSVSGTLVAMYALTFVAFVGGFAVAIWNAWEVWSAKRGWFTKTWSVVLVLSFFILLWLGMVFGLLSFHTEF